MNKVKDCYHCGSKHDSTKCGYKTETLHKCGKIGHIAKTCRNNKNISSDKERQNQKKNFRGKNDGNRK